MKDDPLYSVALQLAKAVAVTMSLLKKLPKALWPKCIEFINVELLSRMTKDQMDSFNIFLDGDPTEDDIIAFVTTGKARIINDVNSSCAYEI